MCRASALANTPDVGEPDVACPAPRDVGEPEVARPASRHAQQRVVRLWVRSRTNPHDRQRPHRLLDHGRSPRRSTRWTYKPGQRLILAVTARGRWRAARGRRRTALDSFLDADDEPAASAAV